MRKSRSSLREPLTLGEGAERVQMLVALLFGTMLVAVALFVWRRPKVESEEVTDDRDIPKSVSVAPQPDREPQVLVTEPKLTGCEDLNSGKIEASECKPSPELANALKQAIVDNEACLPPSEGAATLEYQIDVRFERRNVAVVTPQSSRTVKSSRAAIACANAVKRSLLAGGVLKLPHEHARMKLSARASYAARE